MTTFDPIGKNTGGLIRRENDGSFTAGDASLSNLVLPKAQGYGIKVDPASAGFAWVDLIGQIRPRETGAGSPTLNTFRGGTFKAYSFAANDVTHLDFHIPHDYVMGSNVYIHLHWMHDGTAISGQLDVSWIWHYAKGHAQATFGAETTLTQTILTPNIATIPQYSHRIDEVQLSASGGGSGKIDSALLEPDGLLLVSLKPTAIPTITGGSVARPFILFADLHYQSTGVGTKAKAPGFWT